MDKLGREIIRLAWLQKNSKRIQMNPKGVSEHPFCLFSPCGYIGRDGDSVMELVDVAIKLENKEVL